MKITIRQTGPLETEGPNGVLTFDGRGEYPVTVRDPFDKDEAAQTRLDWYFEAYLRFPYTKQVPAAEAAHSLQLYGTALFEQLFGADRRAFAQYSNARQAGLAAAEVTIVGQPDFQQLFWEALYDPDLGQFVAHQASFRRTAPTAEVLPITPRPSPTLNLLLVVARPFGSRDVGYRTIARPLVETLREAQLPVQIDMIRPGSYEALVKHLEQTTQDRNRGAGYYHLVHFDLHGAVMPYQQFEHQLDQPPTSAPNSYRLYGRPAVTAYEGERAFLFFEGASYAEQAVPAESVAELMQRHQIATVILNACQAGKIGDNEASLAIRLHQAGVQTVVAMRYSLFVSTAKRFIPPLYEQWVQHGQVLAAVQWARQQLAYDKERTRINNNQAVYLEDWLLPVCYQAGTVAASTTLPFPDAATEAAFYERQSLLWEERQPFFGRDLVLLHLEQGLLQHGLLIIEGVGGQGKSRLLRHAARWWQMTDWIKGSFYFGYDEKAWRLAEIVHRLAQAIYPDEVAFARWLALPDPAKQRKVVQALRSQPYLLLLDNCESITGNYLAIKHTLTAAEQAELRDFLQQLRGGRTLILCGSRDGMDWLQQPAARHYPLGGLDAEASQAFVSHLLHEQGLPPYEEYVREKASREPFERLLKLLAGHPLAMQVVLSRLSERSPAEIVEVLEAGNISELDTDGERTESIVACIEYAYHDIDPTDQALLMCLAPFSGVIGVEPLGSKLLENYIQQLRQQPSLAELPFDRLPALLQTAQQRGLLAAHELEGYLGLQPIFPYFLRQRLTQSSTANLKSEIEGAFRQHYDGWGRSLYQLLDSKEPQAQQAGFMLTQLEYENLNQALELALHAQVSIFNLYFPISSYLDRTQEHSRGLQLGQQVFERLESYPTAALQGPLGAEFVSLLDNVAKRYLMTQQYAAAEQAYQRALNILLDNKSLPQDSLKKFSASIYHQLGRVAEEQRQFEQAEQHYQQALQLKIEFNDRYSQASTYHQLGRVAEEQRQFEQAEQHYQQALQLDREFNDRYEQAKTYHQLGMVAQAQRQWAQAEQHYQQALQLKIEFNDRYSQAKTYHQLGIVAQEQRQWAQAEQHCQQALQLFIEFNDRYSQASTYHQLGMVAEEQGQFEQAEQHYQQALQLFIEFNDRYSQAKTYHNLGRVAEEQQQWKQAEQHYQQALQIYIEFNDRYHQASTYHQLGMVAQAQRQWAQAEQHCQQALQLFIEFNDRYSQASTYHQLGMVAEEQGQFEQAVDYLLQAVALFGEYEDAHNLGIAERSLGRVLRAAGSAGLWGRVAAALGVSEDELRELMGTG